MKTTRLFALALVVSLVLIIAVCPASAAWMSNATINYIGSSANGNHEVSATVGSWTKIFTLLSTDANTNACLAVLLTAQTTSSPVSIMYTGSNIDMVYILPAQ